MIIESDQNEENSALPMLGYASSREFERAIFRCIGWVGLGISILLVGRVFCDVIASGIFMKPAPWLVELMDWRAGLMNWRKYGTVFKYWTEAALPIIAPIVALFLLAGSIGCLRRYPRTRYWMICYAILHIVEVLAGGIAILTDTYREFLMYGAYASMSAQTTLLASGFQYAADFLITVAFDIILLWLMTRRHVSEIFKRAN